MKFKNVPHGRPADPFEAFRQLVYTVGVEKLAPAMGLKPGTLYNKADADEDTHHQPSLRDVVLATRATQDMRVVDSLNEMFGRASFDISHLGETSDEALLDLLLNFGSETGDFYRVTHGALLRKRFLVEDVMLCRAEALDVICALLTVVHRLEGLVDGE
ncbi:MAG: phage regulatory CII family protein [Rhodoferax sp.]|uniref:phage regulatory CII family protein n=1 Tax=Rhodoferax sp. TaxID=50421 RepID=UPI0027312CD4|nr:phage regulatory CII family protein [Rhodoferax sp.]MDP1530295.1 phage regulatory CII family protein [Rhodoferax sp.]MDP1943358.1 phage regulatory CII family protein [Rhodoferax sp.]